MGFDISNPGLRLGLCLGIHDQSSEDNCIKTDEHRKKQSQKKKEEYPCNKSYPSLTLGPPADEANNQLPSKTESDEYIIHPHASSPSAVSSFSNSSSIKRERDQFAGEELEPEVEKIQSKVADDDEGGNPRKKLRLTKEQSTVLEDSFKEHSTLNPKQKQELARKLNLRARQVEVWFQNRRARTKLKKTEVDCELLKKCCETLTEENKRLQKELQELKSMKTTPGSFYMQLPVASLIICPSCERICGGGSGGGSNNPSSPTTALLNGPKAHHHFNKNNYTYSPNLPQLAS
ncbi:homeobox-leucine zipper protein HAT9-like [Gastrolobium bilobum]|uniref:homeobox-leucine zipper protein HAT9-like n=1 Tax=Gastrolobium bilobum TaxID=150636 RepID=UPI002AB0B329|nr:homeobox-leucine zipper protein HAT9-like [Gastrolobium bilobum]